MPVAGTHFRQVPLVNNLDPPTKNASSYWSWTGCNIPSSYCCLEILFFLSLQRRSFLCQPMVVALMDRLAHGIVAMKRRPCLGENSARWAIDSMLKSTQMWTGKKNDCLSLARWPQSPWRTRLFILSPFSLLYRPPFIYNSGWKVLNTDDRLVTGKRADSGKN